MNNFIGVVGSWVGWLGDWCWSVNVLLFTVKRCEDGSIRGIGWLVGSTFYYRTILWTEEINPKHGPIPQINERRISMRPTRSSSWYHGVYLRVVDTIFANILLSRAEQDWQTLSSRRLRDRSLRQSCWAGQSASKGCTMVRTSPQINLSAASMRPTRGALILISWCLLFALLIRSLPILLSRPRPQVPIDFEGLLKANWNCWLRRGP